MQQILQDLHGVFIDLVKRSRGARLVNKPDEIFSGRAWIGQRAKDLGLIDGLGTMRATMEKKVFSY